jgi:RNA polymerase sigma-70 factor, ECF subfamily
MKAATYNNHPLRRPLKDKELIALLEEDSEKAIVLIFEAYYGYICKAVYKIIPKASIVEDLAQEVFFELWRKREQLHISTSLKAYLRRAAVNRALNHIRDQRIQLVEAERAPPMPSREAGAAEKLEAAELQAVIDQAIDALPGRCRIIFVLSRFEDMTYSEIAEQLGISIKTVENQMSKALRQLREQLGPFLGLWLLLMLL